MADSSPPMDIRTFARLLDVSESTVSRAFSGKARVKDATRKRIFAKATELGYRPNGRLAVNNIPFAGEQVPVLSAMRGWELWTDFMTSGFCAGLDSVFAPMGWQVTPHILFENAPILDSFYYDVFKAANVKGIVCASGTELFPLFHERLQEWGKPYMVLGAGRPGDPCVNFDVHEAGRSVGVYFRRTGRQRPAVLLGNVHPEQFRNWSPADLGPKELGLMEGMGVSSCDAMTWICAGYTFADGYSAFGRLRETGRTHDCVFCANDILAAGFMRAALDAGLRIPDDLAVVGFDNREFSQYLNPSLTTIDIPREALGRAAANGLMDLMADPGKQINITLKCPLVLRQSA